MDDREKGERRSGISAQLARYDDNDDIYIYIYIYTLRLKCNENDIKLFISIPNKKLHGSPSE